jgi:BirA family biotin operon repressor/biotin-[acetyl-CoA-carboxylase] ligase
MNYESLVRNLRTRWLGHPTIYYEITDSTNSRAALLVSKSKSDIHGTAIIANSQTAGRGTGSSKWISDEPNGMLLSLIVRYPLRKEPIQFVPAIAATEIIREQFGIYAHVKWPNDILFEYKKIGGVLCEKFGNYCVIGIGLNINQEEFPEEICNKAISLYQICHKKIPVESIFQLFIKKFEELYDSDDNLIERWKSNSLIIGKQIVAIRNGQEKMYVTVTDITPEGYLIVEDSTNNSQVWVSSSDLDINPAY